MVTTPDRRTAVSRRQFLLHLGLLAGGATAASLLQACAPATPAATPTTAPAPKPTSAPAAPTAAAAAPTTAPAAKPAATTAPAPAAGATINLHWRTDPPVTFNALFASSGSEQQVSRLIMGALIKMSDKLEPTPDLAERWEISPDAKAYTFFLRKNAKWSDGTPLTAEDVQFTFERAIDKRAGSIWAGRLSGLEGAADYAEQKADKLAGVEIVDPNTVRIKLAKPDGAFLTTIGNFSGLGIVPKHVLKDVPPDQLKAHRFSTQAPTVGAGAFTFVRYESGQFVELKRNDTFWGPKPAVERIFLKILTADVGLAQLGTGEVDFAKVPVSELERIKRDPKIVVHSVVSPSISQIAINNERPYFKDKRVRQAMMYAIDRQGIVSSVLAGQAAVVNSPIIGPEWVGQPEVNPYPFNPAKAKELLKEANWDPNQKIIMLEPSAPSKEQAAYGPIIQQQLRDVGFTVEILQAESAEINKRYIQGTDYDLFDFGGGVYRAEPSIAAIYYHSNQLTPRGGNGTRYVNPKIDQLFDEALSLSDRNKRKELYHEIAKIINEDVPTIFLWSPNSIYGVTKRFQGFKPPAYIDNFVWNAEEWSVSA